MLTRSHKFLLTAIFLTVLVYCVLDSRVTNAILESRTAKVLFRKEGQNKTNHSSWKSGADKNSQKEKEEEQTAVTEDQNLTKEEKIENLISVLANTTKIAKDDGMLNSVKSTLLAIPDVPSLPKDFMQIFEERPLSTAVPPQIKITYNQTWHGYSLPVFIGSQNGRLGNVMGHYATMYALNKLYNASMFITSEMREQLKYFPNLSLPSPPEPTNGSEWRGVAYYGDIFSINYTPYQLAAAGLLGPHKFITIGYPMDIQLFHWFKEELKKEFTFSSSISNEVQNFLQGIVESRKKAGFTKVILVGFHVRLTDYVQHVQNYGGQVPNKTYYHRAMNYYRERFPESAVFVVGSDEPETLKQIFRDSSDVYYAPGTSAELDMAVLNSCHHSIITVGSYGFFSGFLTEGEVVYPDIEYNIEYSFSRKFFERTGIPSFVPIQVD